MPRGLPRVALLVALCASLTLAAAAPVFADDGDDNARLVDGIDLYRRVGQGSVIVLATCVKESGKVTLEVEDTLRSDFGALPEQIEVAFRGANRGRRLGEQPFRVDVGDRAFFVLEIWTDSRGDQRSRLLFRPAGLAKARIPIPAEGAGALDAAVRALVRYHDTPQRGLAEADLIDWIEGQNPWLIDVALNEAARFVMAGPDWVPALLTRTRDVNPARRKLAIEALGGALGRGRFEAGGGRQSASDTVASVRETLVRLARTDEDPAVRRIAVDQLVLARVDDLRQLLEGIAREDVDQDVRLAASAALLELRR